jgi:DUF971 family protein
MVSATHATVIPVPSEMTAHQQSRVLEVAYEDGTLFRLPFELMRVYSPSAEVRGHGPGQETLQTGKRSVSITAIDSVGNYGVKPHFSDGHDNGIYTWEYLFWLGTNQDVLWQDYLVRLKAAGFTPEDGRDAPMETAAANTHGCS